MMRSCASAARLRGGGSILRFGTVAMGDTGSLPPRNEGGRALRRPRSRQGYARLLPHAAPRLGRRARRLGTFASRHATAYVTADTAPDRKGTARGKRWGRR